MDQHKMAHIPAMGIAVKGCGVTKPSGLANIGENGGSIRT